MNLFSAQGSTPSWYQFVKTPYFGVYSGLSHYFLHSGGGWVCGSRREGGMDKSINQRMHVWEAGKGMKNQKVGV